MQTTAISEANTERRAARRYRVLKRGTLAFDGSGVDCTVRNLSATGARIDIASAVGVPAHFTLLIETDQFIRRCRSVWSTDRQLGVAFE